MNITRQLTYDTRRYVGDPPGMRTVTVSVDIDVEGIYRELATKAARNKTGRATSYGGKLKAKVLK